VVWKKDKMNEAAAAGNTAARVCSQSLKQRERERETETETETEREAMRV
jgi:hypothetical protein